MPPFDPGLRYPRVTIEFCVQCKWNLRAAYFAQELLSTFSTSIGEISLLPVKGGIFTITLYHKPSINPTTGDTEASPIEQNDSTVQETLIWDRKRDGGFPETKELKNRVRNVIEPERDMGHVDRALKKGKQQEGSADDSDGKLVEKGGGGPRSVAETDDGSVSTLVEGANKISLESGQKDNGTNGKGQVEVEQDREKQVGPAADCEDCK